MFISTRAPYQVHERTEVGTRPHPEWRGRPSMSGTVNREAGKNEVGHQHVSFLFLPLHAFLSLCWHLWISISLALHVFVFSVFKTNISAD